MLTRGVKAYISSGSVV